MLVSLLGNVDAHRRALVAIVKGKFMGELYTRWGVYDGKGRVVGMEGEYGLDLTDRLGRLCVRVVV